ncbi:site-specific DNA-methyltransferase, partial [Staphylococcus aureus]|uniref:site-specific DNA-methyltransferase n=1 Tax=Staphylococcus aureus TaxID=1280 RepID=UPI0023B0E619
ASNGTKRTSHPAPFPGQLARDHILTWSNPGDLVLDPMCGSGTTCVQAIENGRQFLGFELSQTYVDEANQRIGGARPPLLVGP